MFEINKNAIFEQKKSPAASLQPRKKGFEEKRPKQFFNRFFGPKSYRHGSEKMVLGLKNIFFAKKKAPAASRQPRKIMKNTKIVTKRSNSGRYGLRIGSKW